VCSSDLIINTEKFDIETDWLKLFTNDEFNNDEKLKNNISENLKETYNNEIINLDEELTELENEKKSISASALWNSDKGDSKKKIEIINIKIKNKKVKLNKIKEYLSDIERDNDDILYQHYCFNELLNNIDSIDPDWKKLGLEVWLIIENKNWSYEITEIDKKNNTINLKSLSWNEDNIHYDDFLNAFKWERNNKSKRVEKINTIDELLDINWWDKTFKVQNWEIIEKDVKFNWETKDRVIDYMVSDKWDIFNIIWISNWDVEVRFWKLSEWSKDKKTNITKNKLSLEKWTTIMSFNELNKNINDIWFKPEWKIWKNYNVENINNTENEFKSDFWSSYLNKLSITEIVMAWKMTIDGVEDYLKRWNEVKSAELAMQLSKIIPWEFSEDFVAQTELKQEEAMDKELTALWKIASWPAFKRIEGWILTKNTPQHKIEAWLMLSAKYGVLYPKELSKYDWTFLWYEALWGKIWDVKYEEEKEKAKKAWLPFDEKELLISLLWAQCLRYLKPYRRSKFYKNFKWKIAWGFTEEKDTWYKDANDKRNIWDMIGWWLSEVTSWVIPNALWWAKRAVEKWWTLKEMNTIYFTLIYSGALYNTSSVVLEELKNQWVGWNGMVMSVFWSTLYSQKLFNNTVVELCKDIEKIDWKKYWWISRKSRKLFENASNPWKDDNFESRAKDTIAFWDEYWDVLWRSLNMADWKDWDEEFLETDKLISFWREWKYKDYCNFISEVSNWETTFDKWYLADDAWITWVTWVNNLEIVKKYYRTDTWWSFKDQYKKVIEFSWNTIWWDIKIFKERIEADKENNNWDNVKNLEWYLNRKLREIVAWLMSNIWTKNLHYIDNVEPSWLDLQSIWIKISDLKEFRESEILWDKWDDIFSNAVQKVIRWEFDSVSSIWCSDLFWNTIRETKDNTDTTLWDY